MRGTEVTCGTTPQWGTSESDINIDMGYYYTENIKCTSGIQ